MDQNTINQLKTLIKQSDEDNEEMKCWFCDGKGYRTRIVTGPVGHIEEKCWHCAGTGIYDPDRYYPEPIMNFKKD